MTYALFLACEQGTVEAVKKELLLRGFKGTTTTSTTTVIVTNVTKEDVIKAAYLLQTPMRIGVLLGEIKLSLDLEESVLALETLIGTVDLQPFLAKEKTFHVDCERTGNHEYNSVDISQNAGRLIKRYVKEAAGYVPQVDLKKPDILLCLHVVNEEAWLFLDVVGKDADKRAYKVFNNPHSIKGPTAASLVLLSGWEPGKILLDPYASGGVIPIEAALLATHFSLHFYDKQLSCRQHPLFQDIFKEVTEKLDKERVDTPAKMINAFDAQLRNVSAAKKNAKIGGVDKNITFSKMDVEWIDTKMAGKSVDCIVTQPVEASKHVPEAKAMGFHKQLFYQADFVLTKKGTITFLCQKPDDLVKAAQEYGFVQDYREPLQTGKLQRWVVRFTKK